MPSSYKSKVIAVGSRNSIKEAFFKSCEPIFSSCCDASYWTIGLSINIVEYSDENEDSIAIALWDINTGERFRFLLPNFLRGASGCLIFLDSNYLLLDNLNYWLNLIRENTDFSIPIYIIGSTNDLKNRAYHPKIISFVEHNNLEGFYLISPERVKTNSIILNHLSRKILENSKLKPRYLNLEEDLNSEIKSHFQKFINFFLFCPICGKENHRSHLSKFYFTQNPQLKLLKEKLLLLMDQSKDFDYIYENEIKIGIPCCSCFDKFFSG